jgi:hypothetical protein
MMLLPDLKEWLINSIDECRESRRSLVQQDIPYFEACLKLVEWQLDVRKTASEALENWEKNNK